MSSTWYFYWKDNGVTIIILNGDKNNLDFLHRGSFFDNHEWSIEYDVRNLDTNVSKRESVTFYTFEKKNIAVEMSLLLIQHAEHKV